MTSLRVTLDRRDDAAADMHRCVLASVSADFVTADTEVAEVAVVSGRTGDWPAEVARRVDDGARAVMVVAPGIADAQAVRELTRAVAGRAVVAVDRVYAADRTWAAARDDVAADAAAAALVDSVMETADEDLDVGLLDQLAVIRPLIGDAAGRLRLVHRGEREYLITGGSGSARVTLTGVASGIVAAGLAVDVVATPRRWQIRFDDRAVAAPTVVTIHDESGTHTRPLAYESGRRVGWQKLREAMDGGGEVAYSLDQLADDLDVAWRLQL